MQWQNRKSKPNNNFYLLYPHNDIYDKKILINLKMIIFLQYLILILKVVYFTLKMK